MQNPNPKQRSDEWALCENCGHKLFRIVDVGNACIETKCHSCKAINIINLTKGKRK